MAFPAYVAYGDENNGTGNVTYARPNQVGTIQVGDLELLAVVTANEPVSPPTGWDATPIVEIGTGTPGDADATRLTVFKRVAQVGDGNSTVTDPGDHQVGHTMALRVTNGVTVGEVATDVLTSSSSTITCPSVTTTLAEALIMCLATHPGDSATWPGDINWTNGALTNFGEGGNIYIGHATSDGNGGAFSGVTARKATAGATGTTTSTWATAAAASVRATIAFYQTPAGGALTATLDNFTSSATGQLEIQGTASPTLAAFTLDAYENPTPNNGAANVTLTNFTTTAEGTLAIQGAASITLAAFTLQAHEGPELALGNATVRQRINAAGPTSGTWTSDPISTTTGSTFMVSIARGVWANADDPVEPTDSESNEYTIIGTTHAYASFPGSETATYYKSEGAGDAAHTFSMTFGDNNAGGGDEVTIMALELIGVKELQAQSHVERSAAANVSGVAVTGTGPAIYLSIIWGNGPVGQDHDFQPSSPWERIEAASATGNPDNNGYIQICVAAIVDTAGTLAGTPQNCTWSNPDVNEGGQIYQMVFQLDTGQLGALAATIEAFTIAAAGGLTPLEATANVTLAAFTAAAAGALEILGAAALSVAAFTSSAASTLEIQGSGGGALEGFTLTADGIGGGAPQGALDAQLEAFTTAAAGMHGIQGALTVSLQSATLSAAGELAIAGTAGVVLDDATLAASANVGSNYGALEATIEDASMTAAAELVSPSGSVVMGRDWAETFASQYAGRLHAVGITQYTDGDFVDGDPSAGREKVATEYTGEGLAFSYKVKLVDGEKIIKGDFRVTVLLGTIRSAVTGDPVYGIIPRHGDLLSVPPPNQIMPVTVRVVEVDSMTQATVTLRVRGHHL